MHFLRKLKTILQYNLFYLFLIIFIMIYVIYNTIILKYESSIKDLNSLEGIITNISYTDDKISFILKVDKEKVKANYYLNNNNNKEFNNLLGKKVGIVGKESSTYNNTIPSTFNYKKYLYNNKIYISYTVSNLEILEDENIFYKIKNKFISKINNYDLKVGEYLNLFILGDKSLLANDTTTIYRENGIWHLFAVSGMHISLLILILDKLLKKLRSKKIIISIVLSYFMFLTSFSASVMRSVIFYLLKNILDKLGINLDNKKILYLTASIILLINPFMIYNTGFLYSFLITYSIMLMSKSITGNYFIKILKISLISFIVSMPININSNYEINLLSIFLNIIFVPLVSLFVFPMALITFIMPMFSGVFKLLIILLEFLNNTAYVLKCNLIMPKMPVILIIIYYLVLILFYKFKKRKILIIIFILLAINILLPKLDSNYYVYYLDVGQGDSSVLISPNKKEVIMIDTGGAINSDYHVSNNVIIFLKSLGITHIDLLITSHGDADHMGETLNYLDNYKINNIILNKGSFNNLERVIKEKGNVVDIYKSKYFNYQNINDYYNDNENDSSIITYLKIHNYSFLFMGDASISTEDDLISKYKFNNIDVLKVGHHGSKTSSSKNFINNINPKYSVISVGRNNMYGHPHNEVLNNLSNSNIYRTDLNGTIVFKMKNNNLHIETYEP